MSVHKAVAVIALGQFDEIQLPTGTPGEDEVLIKVAYASMIAFDTYLVDRPHFVESYPTILGFACAGTVQKPGSGITDLQVGDRVTAFALGKPSNKAMQEYLVLARSLVAKVPDSISLEEAATLPDNFVTAYYTLFNQLGLPAPSSFPVTTPPPLAKAAILVYGAGSTAGIYAIQLLSLAGYKNIIATASKRNHEYLQSHGATHTFDYNSPSLLQDVEAAAGGKVQYALDCISAESTLGIVGKLISPQGKVAILLPIKEGTTVTGGIEQEMYTEVRQDKTPFPQTTELIYVRTFNYQQDENLKKNLMPKILPALLESGYIKPSRVRLLNTGTFRERVGVRLDLLRNNKVSGEKVVVEIPKTA